MTKSKGINARHKAGDRYGKLVLLHTVTVRTDKKVETYWACQCDCGAVVNRLISNLKANKSPSCDACRSRHVEGGKFCSKCGVAKPWEAYSKSARAKDGYKPSCKECAKVADLAYRLANPEKFKESKRAWREKNPEHSREITNRHKKKYAERYREYALKWAKENPERVRATGERRRARKESVWIEDVDRTVVFERDAGTCQICGIVVDSSLKWPDPGFASLDHIKPISKGGEHSYANIQLAHLFCNISKKDKYCE